MEQTVFNLELLEEARDFIKSQPKEIRHKIGKNIRRVQKGERDSNLFKKLDGSKEIWEFRTLCDKKYYRLFAFWDKDINTLVVSTHGIVKKTQKTPKGEITKAEAIREKYFENKNKQI
ncbi:MAG: type II toxin-antitoxin system RelE/ParE family toxin [Prevotella sp.]|nr:type II toxin-antitoxin system RelE/ParE family toxin [Prevotella sp.]